MKVTVFLAISNKLYCNHLKNCYDDVKWNIESPKRSQRSCLNKSCKKLFTEFRKKCKGCGGKVITEEHMEPRLAVPKDLASEKNLTLAKK